MTDRLTREALYQILHHPRLEQTEEAAATEALVLMDERDVAREQRDGALLALKIIADVADAVALARGPVRILEGGPLADGENDEGSQR